MRFKRVAVRISFSVLLFTLIISACSCSVVNTDSINYIPKGSIDKNVWNKSIQSADKLANVITSKYTNPEREEYLIQNESVKILQGTGTGNTDTSFYSNTGNAYFEKSLSLYIKDKNREYYSN